MATKKNQVKTYVVSVVDNSNYCGEGAGGAQFAHGKAVINSERLAAWYKEHKGYKVEENTVETKAEE